MMSKERDELLNIAGQCRATASSKVAKDILVDAGSGCLRDLLLDAAKALEALAEPEQEPVAWITEWVQRYRYNGTPIMGRAVSFTKGDAPAVPNPKYIPLYIGVDNE